jgi:hypothetical protein
LEEDKVLKEQFDSDWEEVAIEQSSAPGIGQTRHHLSGKISDVHIFRPFAMACSGRRSGKVSSAE